MLCKSFYSLVLTFLASQLLCDPEKNLHWLVLAAVNKALFNVNIVMCDACTERGGGGLIVVLYSIDTGILHVKSVL